MVSNPTTMLQNELNRLRAENDALRRELFNLRSFFQALQSLTEAEERFKSNDDLLGLLRQIVQQTLDLLAAPDGSLMLLDPATNELEFVIVQGSARGLEGRRLKPGEGIAGWVAANGKPCVVRDVRTDPRFSARIDEAVAFRTQSIAAAPLIGNGRVLGVVEVLNQPGADPFSEVDQALLALFCRFAGEALAEIERASDEAELFDYKGMEPVQPPED